MFFANIVLFFFFFFVIVVPRRAGTENSRTMSGTNVARGDAGRGFPLADRTRASDEENTGI